MHGTNSEYMYGQEYTRYHNHDDRNVPGVLARHQSYSNPDSGQTSVSENAAALTTSYGDLDLFSFSANHFEEYYQFGDLNPHGMDIPFDTAVGANYSHRFVPGVLPYNANVELPVQLESYDNSIPFNELMNGGETVTADLYASHPVDDCINSDQNLNVDPSSYPSQNVSSDQRHTFLQDFDWTSFSAPGPSFNDWVNGTTFSGIGDQFDLSPASSLKSSVCSQTSTGPESVLSSDSDSWLSDPEKTAFSRTPFPSDYFSHQEISCSKCDKKFSQERDLRKHERVHLSDSKRPYPCPMCGKAFRYPKDRTRHKRAVHENKKDKEEASPSVHLCEIEGCKQKQGFGRLSDLMRHLRTVHADTKRGYKCMSENCPTPGKIWLRLDNLMLHLRRMHNDEDEQALLEKSKANEIDLSAQVISSENVSTFNAKQWEPKD